MSSWSLSKSLKRGSTHHETGIVKSTNTDITVIRLTVGHVCPEIFQISESVHGFVPSPHFERIELKDSGVTRDDLGPRSPTISDRDRERNRGVLESFALLDGRESKRSIPVEIRPEELVTQGSTPNISDRGVITSFFLSVNGLIDVVESPKSTENVQPTRIENRMVNVPNTVFVISQLVNGGPIVQSHRPSKPITTRETS
ncbi:hypothetical protein WICPIJ_005823 [Wickerhamomyces pijperi]|uniref:Uncharacterized protein n=1 Tax=Wickerhamomyces pijperi TaxID=599730 RepID=A0A9P8TLL6_WICPI|nr:hypothetical protein WICPIJ_005823 [Wickerhamomyces pijperi]